MVICRESKSLTLTKGISMSKEQLAAFMAQIEPDAELQAAVGNLADINGFVALAAEHGFEVSPEDIAALRDGAELSASELEAVAGGWNPLKWLEETFGPSDHPM
jgi:predicted ribosomally synthesized peptide with nif11-like leader